MSAVGIEAERFSDERTVLQAVVAVLRGTGPAPQRVTEALGLLEDRLRHVKERLHGEGGEPAPAAVVKPDWTDASERGELATSPYASLVGQSEAMKEVYRAIRRVSESHATVLLRGESGTGKELVAKAIHVQGPRAKGPFIRLHCAALTETLLESELFGHERGAFTGAVELRKGRFELAHAGTLFLDEVGDIPLPTQVKLLRVLQERCFERVGGSRSIAVDVRVISATHRDLEAMVRAGTFREDLYYRLNVVPIAIPALRERDGDVPLLIDYFLTRFNHENRRHVRLHHDLLELMERYHWPGNVRELQNCVERLVVLAEHEHVTPDRVPASLRTYFADMQHVTTGSEGLALATGQTKETLGASLQEFERQRLRATLDRTGWVQARAARALGLTPRQVAYKIRKYGIAPG
jgi:Nif-specific regulatory protein